MQRLPAVAAVHRAPRNSRIAVVQLPVDRSLVERPFDAVPLHRDLHPLGLKQLGEIDIRPEIVLQQRQVARHVLFQQPICFRTLLVGDHCRRVEPHLFRREILPVGVVAGQRDEAVFVAEPARFILVDRERFFVVENAPVVHISFDPAQRIAASVHRRTRMVRSPFVLCRHHVGQHAPEQGVDAVLDLRLFRRIPSVHALISPMVPSLVDLVIPAPDGQRRVVPQTPHVVDRLAPHVVEESRVPRVERAGEHEVLPHHHPPFVAQVEEEILFVNPPAPDAEHIHVRLRRRIDDRPVAGRVDPRRKDVLRNVVRPFDKTRNAVHIELETCPLAHAVRLLHQLDFSHADPLRVPIQQVALLVRHECPHGVEVGLAHAVRPPELRMDDGERDLDRRFRLPESTQHHVGLAVDVRGGGVGHDHPHRCLTVFFFSGIPAAQGHPRRESAP